MNNGAPMARTLTQSLFFSFLLSISFVASEAFAEDIFEKSEQALERLRDNVKKYTLPNGLRIIFYRRGIAPVYSSIISVGVGGVDETPGETGVSHMFEHMAFKGTEIIGSKDFETEKKLLAELESIVQAGRAIESFSPEEKKRWAEIHQKLATLWNNEEFSREFERRGAVGLNASTDKEMTRYFESMPKNVFEFWCSLESERIKHPILRQFYQERDVVLEERRMRFDDDPMGRLYEKLLQKAYDKHPYRAPVIGYEKDIRALTATKLDAFRKKFYVPSNIVISIVGDVNPEEDIKLIEKYFGDIPSADRPEKIKVIEPPQKQEKELSIKAHAASAFMVAYHKPHFPNPDDAVITVMSEVLNGSTDSPLLVNLVKKGRFAAGVEHEEGPGVEFPNLLIFSIVPKAPFSNAVVLRKFDETISKFKSEDFDPSLIDVAKRGIATEYLGQMKSNSSLAGTLGSTELQYGNWERLIDWYKEAMHVTAKDIHRVAQKYLVPENRTVGFLEFDGASE